MATRTRTEVVTPIIHGNGTSKESLLEALKVAYSAVRDAMDKLRECAPNGRDYYPEPGRMEKAVAQHRQRQEHLQAVYDSIGDEALAISVGDEAFAISVGDEAFARHGYLSEFWCGFCVGCAGKAKAAWRDAAPAPASGE